MGGTRLVYVQTPNGPERREVTIGLSNDRMAEVVSGLNEGDEVVVNATVLLTPEEKAKFAPQSGGGAKGKGKGKGKDGKPGGGKPGPQG